MATMRAGTPVSEEGSSSVVDSAKPAAAGFGLVVPVDAEQVARVDVPQPDLRQFFLDFRRYFGGVFHLGVGGDDDIALAGAGDGALAPLFVDGQVNGGHGGSLSIKLSDKDIIRASRCVGAVWRKEVSAIIF